MNIGTARNYRACMLSGLAVLSAGSLAKACGGFFCQLVPIVQAAEQIVFRQEGDQVTAVVLIQYNGSAEEFSWVVPVPGIPELSVGSDLAIQQLETATRPQFNLEIRGEPCIPVVFGGPFLPPASAFDNDNAGAADDGVTILDQVAVGPFDATVVSSDDPEAMARWLNDNGYDITDRGAELIGPYVMQGLNFVAVKLRQNQGVGDIQPLIMRYTSDRPMVPIRLTSVAAQPDMGVIVWLLGDARAAPVNYLAVEPNLTRLNWYNGSFAAYPSWQMLVTRAMDEAGGQGFATEYAGRDFNAATQLPDPAVFEQELESLREQSTGIVFLGLFYNPYFPQSKVLEILRRELPLPEGVDESNYSEGSVLIGFFGEEMVAIAKDRILDELSRTVVEPLTATIRVFDGTPYMTRLYTTLSPEEMTIDPEFVFNRDLPDQSLERKATLDLACVLGQTQWSLTLGTGTLREGERVIDGAGDPPTFTGAPTIDQAAVSETALVSESGPPRIMTKNEFARVIIGSRATGGRPLSEICGNGIFGMAMLSLTTLCLMRSRRRF